LIHHESIQNVLSGIPRTGPKTNCQKTMPCGTQMLRIKNNKSKENMKKHEKTLLQ